MPTFKVLSQLGDARVSELTTSHGLVPGPFFQFVATQAVIRGGVLAEDLEKLGVDIVLANTYHLHVRPGETTVAAAGGLHGFMQWSHPVTTDSGGYQVFSLGQNVRLDANGVSFRSPTTGTRYYFTPEKAIDIQTALGADIIMPLDVCTPFGASHDQVQWAVERTSVWAKRCLDHHESASQALYGIVQGGVYADLRQKSAVALRELNFFGYSIGGELRDREGSMIAQGLRMTMPHLPPDKPRYLMGSGAPEDIVDAVRCGVDQFDCVLPVRNARHGKLYYALQREELARCVRDPEYPIVPERLYTALDLRKSVFARDFQPFSPDNPVLTYPYTRAYVHHLLRAEAPSAARLMVLHNIHFYVQLMQAIREVITTHGTPMIH